MPPPTQPFDLPNELILQILSNLPVREIQLARQISPHIKTLIDNKPNRALLLPPSLSSSLKTIQKIHSSITFPIRQKEDEVEYVEKVKVEDEVENGLDPTPLLDPTSSSTTARPGTTGVS